jgi:hypothetical protein
MLDDAIALTRGLFKALAVQYLHGAAQVFNQSYNWVCSMSNAAEV